MTHDDVAPTEVVATAPLGVERLRTFVLRVVTGADSGRTLVVDSDRASVGAHPSNTLALTDRTVSRFHFDLAISPRGLLLNDLGSTNGTFLSGVRVERAYLSPGAVLRAGHTAIEIAEPEREIELPVYPYAKLGGMVGASTAMRRLFAAIVRLAPRNIPMLIQGETGTGKEVVAREIHEQSDRRGRPFVVVDCGAIPPDLAESELFGHVKGAFTGASSDRRGAFEAADGGTLFLDEIGELEVGLQPRLLRAIEARQVKRVGTDGFRAVDVRVIAATHRDLRVAVNDGSFREDLYFRLAVATLWVPPLRERVDDIPTLLAHFYAETAEALGLPREMPPVSPDTLDRLRALPWRGNCRELRNFVDRSLAYAGNLQSAVALGDPLQGPRGKSTNAAGPAIRFELVYKDAKAAWVDHFEKEYVARRLEGADGNITRAAREMEIDRAYFLKLLKKHGIR